MADYNTSLFIREEVFVKSRINAFVDFFRDREYYRQLIRLAFPIALQNLITSSLNMVALILIGQLGEE